MARLKSHIWLCDYYRHKSDWFLAGLRSFCKNEMAPAPELSVFVSMAPAPELCFFVTWLRLHSGCALLIRFNNFGIPSVLLVASERVIPTYFELILLLLPGLCTRKEYGLE